MLLSYWYGNLWRRAGGGDSYEHGYSAPFLTKWNGIKSLQLSPSYIVSNSQGYTDKFIHSRNEKCQAIHPATTLLKTFSEVYTFTHPIRNTLSSLHLLQQLLRNLLQTSRTSSEEAKVRSWRIQHLALVFRMKLDPDIPGMIFQFDNLHALARVVLADEIEPDFFQAVHIFWIHFVAMSVALFGHFCISV